MALYQSKYTGKQIDDAIANQKKMSEIVIRNSKQIENLKQGSADPFETDLSVAYVKDVPENALPYAEIKKIGGMTYKDGNTLKSAKVTEVKSVGINLWDEEWEVGGLDADTGYNYYATDRIRSVNYCHCLPNTRYWAPPFIYLVFYDKDKNYIGQTAGNKVITTPNNTCYFRVCGTVGYGTVYKYDLCINKSDETINGKYYPYQRNTLPIPEAVRNLDGYGLGVSDTVYNYIDWENKRFVKRVEKLVLDGVNGKFTGGAVYNGLYYGDMYLPSAKKRACLLGDTFKGVEYASVAGEMNVNDSYMLTIFAPDPSIQSVSAFNSWLVDNPSTIIYELATPEITDISGLISSDNLIEVEGGGTLTFNNEYEYAVPSEVEYQVEV